MSSKTKIPFHWESVQFIAQSIFYFFQLHFIDPFRAEKKSSLDIGRFFEGRFPSLLAWVFVYYWALVIASVYGLWWLFAVCRNLFFSEIATGLFVYLSIGTYPVYFLVWILFIFPHKILVRLLKKYKNGIAYYWVITTLITLLVALGLDYLLRYLDYWYWDYWYHYTTQLFLGLLGIRLLGFLLIHGMYAGWYKQKYGEFTPITESNEAEQPDTSSSGILDDHLF